MGIVVTGAHGFIGSAIVKEIKGYKKYHSPDWDFRDVYTPTSKELDLTNEDATLSYLYKISRDNPTKFVSHPTIIHCANVGGNSIDEDESVYNTNMAMFNNLWKFFNDPDNRHSRFINFGSGAEMFPTSQYGRAKRHMLSIGRNNYKYHHLRIYGCLGKNEPDKRFIKSAINNYINKQNIIIHQDKLFDLVAVEDVAYMVNQLKDGSIDLKRTVDFTYEDKHYLSEIAYFINKLDNHRVSIIIEKNEIGEPYVGYDNSAFNGYIYGHSKGLWDSIEKMYKELKENK